MHPSAENNFENVGRGQVGSYKEGSANALDGRYFIGLKALVGGWDAKDEKALGYANFQGPFEYFPMISSLDFCTRTNRQNWLRA